MKNLAHLSTIVIFLSTFQSAWADHSSSIRSYFNYNTHNSYTDQYRNIHRKGDNLEQVILDTLSLAKREVVVAVHELRLPAVALKLKELREQGVSVRVLVDNSYNNTIVELIHRYNTTNTDNDSNHYDTEKSNDLFSLIDINGDGKITNAEQLKRDAIYILRQSNIEIKDDTSDGSVGSGLMHHKFIVVDGKTILSTSANFTMSCIHGDFTKKLSRGNRNAAVVIHDQKVAKSFLEEFNLMWGSRTSPSVFGVRKPFRGAQQFTLADGTMIKLQFSPSPRSTLTKLTTNGLISGEVINAKESVDAALFVFSEQKIANALKIANRNGAKIDVLVEAKFAYRYYSELLDLWGVALLRTDTCQYENNNNPWTAAGRSSNAGVPSLSPDDVLHHKFAVLDSSKVIFGSHNWSQSADYLNDEFLLVIENQNIASAFLAEHNFLKQKARYGAPRTLLDRIDQAEVFCSPFFR